MELTSNANHEEFFAPIFAPDGSFIMSLNSVETLFEDKNNYFFKGHFFKKLIMLS